MEKFHQYSYDRRVSVHEREPLLSTPKRPQGMFLRLHKYDIEITLLANTLSRTYLPERTTEGSVEDEIESINMV
jgi:hypothetical protein